MTTEQSKLSYLWYGDDEDSFLSSFGRNLLVFSLGGVFGAAALKLTKDALNKSLNSNEVKRQPALLSSAGDSRSAVTSGRPIMQEL